MAGFCSEDSGILKSLAKAPRQTCGINSFSLEIRRVMLEYKVKQIDNAAIHLKTHNSLLIYYQLEISRKNFFFKRKTFPRGKNQENIVFHLQHKFCSED